MGVQLTPGQRFLLDLLQRKLLSTIQSYAKLSLEKQELAQNGKDTKKNDNIDAKLDHLKEKIKRISARQKRFTLEIINGNGNNTIPKESFFEALGLVTREALIKLNSKSNERRRRTTANPRFSHEAIQAKKALEPTQKKQRNNTNNTRTGGKPAPGRSRCSLLTNQERRELLKQFTILQRKINLKLDQINDKRESNRKLEEQNESIRKRGLDMISAINKIYENGTFREGEQGLQGALEHGVNQNSRTDLLSEPYDILLKCDESLDGLD